MGLFNLFNKKTDKQDQSPQDSLKLQGPKYLRDHLTPLATDNVSNVKIKDADVQWIGQLKSTGQNRRFQIKYYGDLLNNETIIDNHEGVQQIVAVATDSNEEILLFDKMLHGWEGFICDRYQDQKNISRNANKLYKSKHNTYSFEIVVVAFYNSGTRHELLETVTSSGEIELENGLTLNIQDAFDDAFDAITIYAIDEHGNKFELTNEELA